MKTYKSSFAITETDYAFFNMLLSLEDIDNPNGIIDTKKDDSIYISTIYFGNGNYISIYLCSGSTNYYYNITLFDKEDNELDCVVDDIDIGENELYYDDELYIFEMVVVNNE